MADIKTRDAVKGTIKTIDKAAIASERMKSAYSKTKDKAEQGYYSEESSVTEYASDKVSYAADRIKDEGTTQPTMSSKCREAVWSGKRCLRFTPSRPPPTQTIRRKSLQWTTVKRSFSKTSSGR